MTYTDFVTDYIGRQELREPIYTSAMASEMAARFDMDESKAAAAVSVALKRVIEDGRTPDLRKFQKGVYYRTVDTPFGEVGIKKGKLIDDRYILPDKGYETGAGLLYRLGLTTQVPARRIIATNAAKGFSRYDKNLDISICPPKTEVTAENKNYLRVLDVLNMIGNAPIDEDNPYDVIGEYISNNSLSYELLLFYAVNFYNERTVVHLGYTARKE